MNDQAESNRPFSLKWENGIVTSLNTGCEGSAPGRTLAPLAGDELRAALADDETRLHAWLVWRDIERRGWSMVAERDPVAVLALRVMLAHGTVVAHETGEGLWLVEAPIVTDEAEDEREARLAAEAWEASTYDDGRVRWSGGEP